MNLINVAANKVKQMNRNDNRVIQEKAMNGLAAFANLNVRTLIDLGQITNSLAQRLLGLRLPNKSLSLQPQVIIR